MSRVSTQLLARSTRGVVDTSRYRNPDTDPSGPYLLADITVPFYRPSLRYSWRGVLPPSGRSWRFTSERAEALEAEGRIVFSSTGRPRLKRYLSEAVAREAPLSPAPSKLELIVRAAMKEIAAAIAEDPTCLKSVEWRDLERTLREVFEGLGFATRLTRSGKDGGFDIELTYAEGGEQRVALVEVKHWAPSGKKPGKRILTSLVDVVARAAPGTVGLLLSSTGFASDVIHGRTKIQQVAVRLGDKAKIVSLCQSYVQGADGLWRPTTDLGEMLMVGTQ